MKLQLSAGVAVKNKEVEAGGVLFSGATSGVKRRREKRMLLSLRQVGGAAERELSEGRLPRVLGP